MTKKHFEVLAAIVRDNLNPADGFTDGQRKVVAEELADFCVRFNPGFERLRFLRACGVMRLDSEDLQS